MITSDADGPLKASLLDRAEKAIRESGRLAAIAQVQRVAVRQQIQIRHLICQGFEPASRVIYPSETIDMRLRSERGHRLRIS